MREPGDFVHKTRENDMERVFRKWKVEAQASAQNCSNPNSDEKHIAFRGADLEMEMWSLDGRVVEVTEIVEGCFDSCVVAVAAPETHTQRLLRRRPTLVDERLKSSQKGFLRGRFMDGAVLVDTLGVQDDVAHLLAETNFQIPACVKRRQPSC